MNGIVDALKNLLGQKRDRGTENVNELRMAFRARYHQFKLLLSANSKALGIMAEMEEALKGHRPFGMTFIQSRCTAVSTSVWQIIKNLNELAPAKYETLFERFGEIQERIGPFLQPKGPLNKGLLVLPIQEANREVVDQVGGKIANLGEVRNKIGLNVSDGFAITTSAYRRFLSENDLGSEVARRIQAADVATPDQLHGLSADLQQLIIHSPVPEDLEQAVLEQYRILEESCGRGVTVAVRSSALGEDFAGASFAGQFRTQLNVGGENILQAYKEVLASKYSLQAMNYRLTRGIRDDEVPMGVACMRMVKALSGGVVYSRNPLDIRDDRVAVHSVWGLPKPIVDGVASSDFFLVSRANPLTISKKKIALKEQKYLCHPKEGISRRKLAVEEGRSPSLSEEQALELARLAVVLEGHFGAPLDIEWAIEKSRGITILQCRPLQQVERPSSSEGEVLTTVDAPLLTRGGVTASPGVGAGPVFIIRKDADILQFPDGAVLVTEQALPRWSTMLDRAAAVVTERGGVAGHLASVAREYGVPAIFGGEDAVRLLESDQPVTVDADARRVYEGRVTSLLLPPENPRNLMEGSRVFEALKDAAGFITPLTLLDPDAPTFNPRNCRTLHDITRFCHEYAVKEMFLFGKEHTFPERSGKRLVSDTPMQWLILNLDDGFKEEVASKQVRLDNIASIPMLGLWEGISAFQWAGPPPIDGKGFLSVMFEATQNTSLVPGMRSRYTGRNYFMISKNYCNLNSRLGFHFSIVEALVSKRSGENYVSFQFKGGATDNLRRQKRLFFISEVLSDYHFQVQTKGDHLMARLEERDMEYMIDCLRVLGYLTIHTRQLDMIMSNNKAVSYYRRKFRKDIQHMLGFFGSDQNGDRPTMS